MMFHVFGSPKERKRFGSSALIEIQFCKMPYGTKPEKLVAVDSIDHWQNDSLYTDDESAFYREYSRVFNCGIYSNLQSGTVDVYGINYYAPSCIDPIMAKLRKERPADHQTLIEWLTEAKRYNGFYILGI